MRCSGEAKASGLLSLRESGARQLWKVLSCEQNESHTYGGEQSTALFPPLFSISVYLGSISNFTNLYRYQKAVLKNTKWASSMRDRDSIAFRHGAGRSE